MPRRVSPWLSNWNPACWAMLPAQSPVPPPGQGTTAFLRPGAESTSWLSAMRAMLCWWPVSKSFER
eukprot:3453101-Alexandrium_andersonii.AAC.1